MTISISDLTSNVVVSDDFKEIGGDGVFDHLMSTVNTHLNAQFELGRITGTDYANVYLGALQATVQQAVAFLLGMTQTNSQIEKTDKEIAVLDNQISTNTAKTNAEVAVLAQQEITEFSQTGNTTKTTPASNSLLGKQIILLDNQATTLVEKTDAEVAVLAQKEITEFSQTLKETKVAPDADSVMGSQIELQNKQAKSFLWHAQNKHLNTIANMWNINTSTAGVASTGITAINATGTGNMNDQIDAAKPVE